MSGPYKYAGFTREQMAAAFDRVKNPSGKAEIDAYCNEEDREVVGAAVMHFTGMVPRFYRVGNTSRYRVISGEGR